MQLECGSTRFDCQDDFTGKVKVQTSEGSSIAIPCEDIMKFAACYARQQRAIELDKMSWQEILTGALPPKKR